MRDDDGDNKKPGELRGLSSMKELNRLLEERAREKPLASLDHPRPSWVDDANDSARVRMRMRERRIRYLENRMDGAQKKMERDFDRSS